MKQKEFNEKFVSLIRKSASTEFIELLADIKDGAKISALRAIEVYQEDYQARLIDALKNTFLAIHNLLGDDLFHQLGNDYINAYPSHFFDLDQYGDNFSSFLISHNLLEDYVFLCELANFEWNFREVFHLHMNEGADGLKLMEMLANGDLQVQLVSSARVLHYNYQITKLYALKDFDDKNDDHHFDFHIPEFILMNKNGQKIKTHILSKNQSDIIERFLKPNSLLEVFSNPPPTITPEEIQSLFQILGTDRLLLPNR